MSYTNTTPNYGLPQYVAGDKPTYLGDFNKAMLDIDTAMKNNDTKASSAESTANSANATSTQALDTATNAQSTAENADTNANQAKTLVDNLTTRVSNAETDASSAKSLASTANNNANSAVQTANVAQSTAETAKTSADNALSLINGTVIFNPSTPTAPTNITLDQSINNFSYIEIEYELSTNNIFNLKSTGRIAVAPEMYVILDFIRPGINYLQFFSDEILIKDTSITNFGNAHLTIDANGQASSFGSENNMKIVKVIAY